MVRGKFDGWSQDLMSNGEAALVDMPKVRLLSREQKA